MVFPGSFSPPCAQFGFEQYDALQLNRIEMMLSQLLVKLMGKDCTFDMFQVAVDSAPDLLVLGHVEAAVADKVVPSKSKQRRLRAAHTKRKMWMRLYTSSAEVDGGVCDVRESGCGKSSLADSAILKPPILEQPDWFESSCVEALETGSHSLLGHTSADKSSDSKGCDGGVTPQDESSPSASPVITPVRHVSFGGCSIHKYIRDCDDPCQVESDRKTRLVEVTNLRQDMDNLQAELARMVESHQSDVSNLKRQLHCCSGDFQQGLDTVTKQMAKQADCLIKAFRDEAKQTN